MLNAKRLQWDDKSFVVPHQSVISEEPWRRQSVMEGVKFYVNERWQRLSNFWIQKLGSETSLALEASDNFARKALALINSSHSPSTLVQANNIFHSNLLPPSVSPRRRVCRLHCTRLRRLPAINQTAVSRGLPLRSRAAEARAHCDSQTNQQT